MKKETYYTYLGTNGTITSPVHLEDIYHTVKYALTAEEGKSLTKDGTSFVSRVVVPENEVELWKEVKTPTGQK